MEEGYFEFQCTRCATYALLPSDKRGKTGKVTCRVCSNALMVSIDALPFLPARGWWYMDGGEPVGPIDERAFASRIASRQVLAETLVWENGLSEWVLAHATPSFHKYSPHPVGPVPTPNRDLPLETPDAPPPSEMSTVVAGTEPGSDNDAKEEGDEDADEDESVPVEETAGAETVQKRKRRRRRRKGVGERVDATTAADPATVDAPPVAPDAEDAAARESAATTGQPATDIAAEGATVAGRFEVVRWVVRMGSKSAFVQLTLRGDAGEVSGYSAVVSVPVAAGETIDVKGVFEAEGQLRVDEIRPVGRRLEDPLPLPPAPATGGRTAGDVGRPDSVVKDFLLLVGALSYPTLLTCTRICRKGIAFDPLQGGAAFTQLRNPKIVPTYIPPAGNSAGDRCEVYRKILRDHGTATRACVLMPGATRADVIGCISAAWAEDVEVLYFAEGDDTVLWSLKDHRPVFSAALELDVATLLRSVSGVEVLDPGSPLPPKNDLNACAELARHSECCPGLPTQIKREFERSSTNNKGYRVYMDKKSAHPDLFKTLLQFKSFVQWVDRAPSGDPVFGLRDSDTYKSLFTQGAWLEYAVAGIATRALNTKNVALRVRVRLEGIGEREIDVVASTGSSLILIECKGGAGWNRNDLARAAAVGLALNAPVFFVASDPSKVAALQVAAGETAARLVTLAELNKALRDVVSEGA